MLLSSVAERVYWMSRYIERAENTARIILVNHNLLLDLPRNTEFGWEALISITGNDEIFRQHHAEATERNVLRFLVADERNHNCIVCSLGMARENLRTTRAIVPRDAWEILNDLHAYARDNRNSGISRRGRFAYMRRIIDYCQMLVGKLSGTMSHDTTYEFIRMGRNMERADMVTRVLDVRASNLLPSHGEELKPFDDIQWKSVLESLEAYQMYRRQVHVSVRGRAVLSFLLQDDLFPRTVHYCLGEIEQCLRGLPGNESALRVVGRAQRLVKEVAVNEILKEGLDTFIDDLQKIHGQLNQQLTDTYFKGLEEQPAALKAVTV
jgi:uncharacterized alpha-E superfamily protein